MTGGTSMTQPYANRRFVAGSERQRVQRMAPELFQGHQVEGLVSSQIS